MTSAEASAVWRRVFASMDIWEQDVGQGSARPAFVTAWLDAVRAVPLHEPWTSRDRERCWKAWLEAGKPLTQDRQIEILRQAQKRAREGLLFGGFPEGYPRPPKKPPEREPGEEG